MYEVISMIVIMAVIGSILFGVSGTWPTIVAVKSESMIPNINVGDLVFVVEKDRFGPLMTANEAKTSGVRSFNDYGDVIIYQPNGNAKVTPIIHRILTEINASIATSIGFTGDAAHAGYITKGDHNPIIDQGNIISHIGVIQPVKREWIVGKALFAIPLIGYLSLYIREFLIIIIISILIILGTLRSKKRIE
ncbi:MAG TPA: signal peptidase I [Methanocorpusculum sp.]|nr:signal peptidase I [Methanocorpusculum sp.]